MKTSAWIFAFALLLSACGDGTSDDDGGSPTDAAGSDSGNTDSGSGDDDGGGGTDGGDPGDDSGTGGDGGSGNVCTAAMPCTGGLICTGDTSCTADWSCVGSGIPCTDDAVTYCGCDGTEFTDSSTCVTRPFRHRGACAGTAGFNCDRSLVRCRAAEPMCPDGQVAEVEGTCWTFRCVPLTDCGCSDGAECPGSATCDSGAMRCQR